jgi:phenylalanyl-tRNA synthetase beta chain
MRVPLSWLRDFAPVDVPSEELATTFDELGLVVDGVEEIGRGLDDVVVARILATRPHPDADKVQLVDVDAGESEPLQIVCGAFNFAAGDVVPLARVGATLPNGAEIGRRKVRGQWSDGMLCAPDEIGFGTDHDGIMVLATGAAPGTPLKDALGIEQDVVFDLDVTPNRPDAMSVAGVARDIAAKLRVPFTLPEPPSLARATPADRTVVVEALDLCPRFTATPLTGVGVERSPQWLQRRLTLAGMRPINNVVDVSNYVMLELGHPNHPYDLDRLPGAGLLVRRARPGEVVVTLDDVERVLGPDDCLICDAEGTGVGIGGIMGGATSEIAAATTRVLLEAAYFTPMVIARTSMRLGLRTEASARFERGVDPEGIERAVARFVQLLGPEAAAGELVDVRGATPEPTRVRVRTTRVNAVLGTSLADEEVRGYLEPIGFACTATAAGGEFDVTIPTWRPDSEREIDVIEEVARHHGYADIERTMPPVQRVGGLTPHQRERRRVRDVLAGAGLSEAVSTSFVSADDLARAGLATRAVEVENPVAHEHSLLRTSLFPGLLHALAHNASHRNDGVALFEIGTVFAPPADDGVLPDERERVSAVLAGRDARDAVRVWRTLADALGLDRAVLEPRAAPGLHPTRTAAVVADGVTIGLVGEVDPAVVAAHDLGGRVACLDLDLALLLGAPRRSALYRPVSRFPSSDIDLAFTVPDEVGAGAIRAALEEGGGELLVGLRLFDVYRGEALGDGVRSLAYRLRFQAPDRTLTDNDVADVRRRCIEAAERLGARLRT